MSSGWEYALANEFKRRDNPTNTPIGACIGKVLSTYPPKISIQNGNFIIDEDKLYVSYHLLERDSDYDSMTLKGDLNHQCSHPCTGSYTATASGHIKLNAVWKAGDLVLVIPSQNEQQFFVIDVLRKISGCNDTID